MELQNKNLEDKNEKDVYRTRGINFLIISIVLFSIYIYCIYTSSTVHLKPGMFESIDINPIGIYGGMAFLFGLITAGISIKYFFKYKLNKENFAFKDIPAIVFIGIILILLIILLYLI
jgi:hypothetical protein